MTAEELFRVLELAIHDGHGDAEVYFDTCGKTFEYHMAKVDAAYLENNSAVGEPFINLTESRY